MDKKDITQVLMVGGGSRIPAVVNVVSKFFEDKGIVKFTNPEECVAMGIYSILFHYSTFFLSFVLFLTCMCRSMY